MDLVLMQDRFWTRLTLPGQFLIAGAAVMAVAMLVVGLWVSQRIENAVVQNSATAAALYMESFISPLGQELGAGDELSEPAKRALIEIFQGTPLGERIVSYKIWKPGGLVVYASDADIIGRTFEPSDDLRRAWQGEVAASFGALDDEESAAEAALGVPLLEVYSPVRQVWNGEVIAVAEFYERADALMHELADARRTGWMVVGATFLVSGLMLFGIVRAGGRVIRDQQRQLQRQLRESQQMAQQNLALKERVVNAAARATAQADRHIRRIGADLHDGPAQHLALAALRMDAVLPDTAQGRGEAEDLRTSLNMALKEIRAVSRGLSIPDLDGLPLRAIVERAVEDHIRQTRDQPALVFCGPADPKLSYSAKLCVFRFLQETLSNATRYAPDAAQSVTCEVGQDGLRICVTDQGPGIDPDRDLRLRADGGQGLLGLIDRAESLGGSIEIDGRPGSGAQLRLLLPIDSGEGP